MKVKVPVTVLTTSSEKFMGKDGNEVHYGLYIVQGEEDMLIRGTCASELVDVLSEYKGAPAKLIYEIRVDEKFKPVLKLVGVE